MWEISKNKILDSGLTEVSVVFHIYKGGLFLVGPGVDIDKGITEIQNKIAEQVMAELKEKKK